MPLPSSGQISMSQFSVEMGQASTFLNSMSWINARAKVTSNAMSGHYSKAWYQRNADGNCNNGNCTNNCNCGNIQCTNCFISGGVNCANCDGQAWLQANCNCACSYNCSFSTTVTYNCNCDCACNCYSCFLAGSLIALADGRFVPIEDVRVGDMVIGGRGEHNRVLALDRVKVGKRKLAVINGHHRTSQGHPHYRIDGSFGVTDPREYLDAEQGSAQPVILGDGSVEMWGLPGLPSDQLHRVEALAIGDRLIGVHGQSTVVHSLTEEAWPSDTQLYNLVVSGSHTYIVNGFCVSGFFNAQDFDHLTWSPRGTPWTIDDYRAAGRLALARRSHRHRPDCRLNGPAIKALAA